MAGDGNGGTGFTRPYNVLAAFPTEREATMAVERLTSDGIPRSAVVVQNPEEASSREETAELRAEMQDEVDAGWVGPAGLVMTESQAKGAFAGTLVAAGIGAVVGLAIGLVWAYAADSTLSRPARIILWVFLGLLGGGTVGFLAGGIEKHRREGAGDPTRPQDDRRMVGERGWLIAVHADESALAERAAAVLRDIGAQRVDLVDASGTPLPPQSEHPRPADPPGWWWRRAGRG
jgi:hypothetical protein